MKLVRVIALAVSKRPHGRLGRLSINEYADGLKPLHHHGPAEHRNEFHFNKPNMLLPTEMARMVKEKKNSMV
jgi:hypothetical protein